MIKILRENALISMLIIFVVTLVLCVYDPIGLDNYTKHSNLFVRLWYVLPGFFLWIAVFFQPGFGRLSLDEDPKEVMKQKVNSILRHILTSISFLVGIKTSLGLNIPLLDNIFAFVQNISTMTDAVVGAIFTLISFGTIVWVFIKSGLRYEFTAKGKKVTGGRKL